MSHSSKKRLALIEFLKEENPEKIKAKWEKLRDQIEKKAAHEEEYKEYLELLKTYKYPNGPDHLAKKAPRRKLDRYFTEIYGVNPEIRLRKALVANKKLSFSNDPKRNSVIINMIVDEIKPRLPSKSTRRYLSFSSAAMKFLDVCKGIPLGTICNATVSSIDPYNLVDYLMGECLSSKLQQPNDSSASILDYLTSDDREEILREVEKVFTIEDRDKEKIIPEKRSAECDLFFDDILYTNCMIRNNGKHTKSDQEMLDLVAKTIIFQKKEEQNMTLSKKLKDLASDQCNLSNVIEVMRVIIKCGTIAGLSTVTGGLPIILSIALEVGKFLAKNSGSAIDNVHKLFQKANMEQLIEAHECNEAAIHSLRDIFVRSPAEKNDLQEEWTKWLKRQSDFDTAKIRVIKGFPGLASVIGSLVAKEADLDTTTRNLKLFSPLENVENQLRRMARAQAEVTPPNPL